MTGATKIEKLLIGAVSVALILFAIAAGSAVWGASEASDNSHRTAILASEIKTLLLDGKTASAISAKKTAIEVKSLLTDHAETVKSQQELASAIAAIERHEDATIRAAILEAEQRVVDSLGSS